MISRKPRDGISFFPESPAAGHSGPPDPEDDEVITTPRVSDDDMSSDGDSPADTKEVEQGREPMR